MNLKMHVLILSYLVSLGMISVAAGQGSFVFSTKPIDAAKPQDLSTTFAAGDHIYGLIQLPQTWRALGKAEGQDKLVMAVYTTIDSKRLAAYMELRSDQHLDAKHLLFDIAAESLGLPVKAETGPDMSAAPPDEQPDFSKPDGVLADIERMRMAALKKKMFALVGKCGTAANKIKSAVQNDPESYQPEVKRIWLDIHQESKKTP